MKSLLAWSAVVAYIGGSEIVEIVPGKERCIAQ